MRIKRDVLRSVLLAGSALAGSLVIGLSPAAAQEKSYRLNLPAQSLGQSLMAFGTTTDQQIVFSDYLVKDRAAPALQGDYTPTQALAMLLQGTGLIAQRNADGVVMIARASDPQSGSAAGDGADAGTVQALIVTAQKKEEAIQDVPIAISAFTEKSLDEQKIEGGFDLLKAIPNVTFSKNNFTSYNFSIRGIGTKAVSATTDPGVAVSFNNTTLIQNRLFEQEYFDIERVEVLRGPQGTLYGRNATAGVINVITAKPNMTEFSGSLKGEVGNYHAKRAVAMLNIPLVEDKLALRFAGSYTNREGYDFNSITQHAVNGRDLWSARLTLAFNPTERLRSNLIWERFNEDDNRSRTGKQLCHRDPGPSKIGDVTITGGGSGHVPPEAVSAIFSQGCKPGSLYNADAFGTPNGFSLPFVFVIPLVIDDFFPYAIMGPSGPVAHPVGYTDPYGGKMQSPDLRVIASYRDPIYRAKADVVQLNLNFDLTPSLMFASQTVYDKDMVYSFQDYNRFNTGPIFQDSSNWYEGGNDNESRYRNLTRGGIFCDPQLGCSSSLAGFDISQAKSRQFSQEFRFQSNFDGPVNFSVGANYTKFDVLVDYYVMYNLITMLAMSPLYNHSADINTCDISPNTTATDYIAPTDPRAETVNPGWNRCIYIDPNPVDKIDGNGHNYFRSKNPYKLKSSGYFGEVYWGVKDNVKVTAGLRYNDDHKVFSPIPSQVLLTSGVLSGGTTVSGYPADPDINQHWGEFTGRLGADWKPTLPFTDQTMVYAFYSRGYKGGGANPPRIGYSAKTIAQSLGYSPGLVPSLDVPALRPTGVEYGQIFKPEFVNAFEVGTKNTLLSGALMFNADAFFYDYKDYQVSQIRDRTAVNENFDARIWGLEFETLFSPTRNLKINANLGYLNTAIGGGAKSIDIMNRTQGNPDWMVVRPWVELPSNCIAPVSLVQQWEANEVQLQRSGVQNYFLWCGGWGFGSALSGGGFEQYGFSYNPATDAPNGGAGFFANLKGNKLPNSPHWTTNIGVQYGHNILDGAWQATVRADAYWQSQSWARVYNDNPYDKLHGWYNVNLSAWIEKPDDGLKIELYAKNLLDKTPITDAFLNSDDTDLTTNVFTLDPRLIGLSIKKDF